MFGGREFVERIVVCATCGFRFLDPIVAGGPFYECANVTEYLRLQPARRRYFAQVRSQVVAAGLRLPDGACIADVAAGAGDWLDQWPGTRPHATETHADLTAGMRARSIAVATRLSDFATRFALISAFDYLEHVADPGDLIAEMLDHLVPGGYLVLGVPNMGKWPARLLGTRYYLYCPMHYSGFTRTALSALLRRHSRGALQVMASPPMKATLAAVCKWVAPALNHAILEKVWLPVGYSASLIAILRHQSDARPLSPESHPRLDLETGSQ
jgi:SAM-dependent methyltransferase